MTTSLHNPFIVPQRSAHAINEKFKKRIEKTNDANLLKIYRQNNLKFKCALYADEAIEDFFAEYKKRKDYNNTIFIIVGDHNIKTFPVSNIIELYHVPLIIYSPLLIKTGDVKDINCHRDILPSLAQLLNQNFDLEMPEINHWLSGGLRIEEKKWAKLRTSFSTLNGECCYMYDQFIYDESDKIYEVKPGLKTIELKDDKLKKELKKKYEDSVQLYKYVISHNKISRKRE